MKRLFLILTVAVLGLTAVSCADFFEDILDKLEDMEDADDEWTDGEEDGVVTMPSEEELRASFEYERYLKHVKSYPSISFRPGELQYGSYVLLFLSYYDADFYYDEFGRPLSVEQTTRDPKTELSRIFTMYEFAYLDNATAQLREMRTDYDREDNVYYAYKDEFSTFKPYNCLSEYNSSYFKMYFTHDGNQRVKNAKVGYEEFINYDFTYDDGRMVDLDPSHFPSADHAYDGQRLSPDVNVDYNALLLTTDFMDYSYQHALPLFLRMGGNIGDYMLSRYFIASGESGGGYVIALPEEYAGQTVRQEGELIAYNEDWAGASVSYEIEDGYVAEMHIYLPVTLYRYEYDAHVSNELLYPDYPEVGYRIESVSNETREKLEECTVEYIYEFTYYTKEEVLNK